MHVCPHTYIHAAATLVDQYAETVPSKYYPAYITHKYKMDRTPLKAGLRLGNKDAYRICHLRWILSQILNLF